MLKKVDVGELQNEIADFLQNYREEIQEDVVEVADKVTKEAVEELKATSPKGRRGAYARGWATKTQTKNKLKYHKIIWNKTNYQLTHLLEFGHAKRNGGYTSPSPSEGHIRPVEKKFNQEFVDLLKDKIRR